MMTTETATREIEVHEIQPQPTLNIRVQITPDQLSAKLGEILPEVMQYIVQRGLPLTNPPYARYHAFGPESVDLEGGFVVDEPVEGAGRIQAGQLPGGSVAVILHVGHYDQLMDSYKAVEEWLAAQSRERAGGPWELYLTDPGENPDPATWKTEIYTPIK